MEGLPPLLIPHGDDDDVIPVSFADARRDAVVASGGEAELYVYAVAGYSFNAPLSSEYSPGAADEAHRRTTEFLRRQLMPRYGGSASYVYPPGREELIPGHRMALLDSAEVLRRVVEDVAAAKRWAEREAAEILPADVDEDRNGYLRRILEGRLILETPHIHGLQPAPYGDFMDYAMDSKW